VTPFPPCMSDSLQRFEPELASHPWAVKPADTPDVGFACTSGFHLAVIADLRPLFLP
jgi:hypothetical protein